MMGRLLLLLALVPVHGLSGQRLSARGGTYFEVGLGAARLTEGICGSCTGSHRSIGPALLLRLSERIGPAFELGGEFQATVSGGRHFEVVLVSGTLVAPAEYAPWLRLGGGLLLHPGVGNDVLASAGGGDQHGVDLGMGIVIGVGLDIPLRDNRSLSPQASYIHQIGAERRFSLVMIGASLRLF
jgi:hypothetical protein